jgi:hypothetical protein
MSLKNRAVFVSIGAAVTALCLGIIAYGVPADQPFYQNPAAMYFAGKAVLGVSIVVMGCWPYKQRREIRLARLY